MTLPDIAARPEVRSLVKQALAEDVGPGDVTTKSLVPDAVKAEAVIIARQAAVVSGLDVAAAVFSEMDSRLVCRRGVDDGDAVAAGTQVMTIEGSAASILTAERTALNFLQRMTGIATLTRRFVEVAAPHGVTILDTRKTTPLLRPLEKYAVLCGGGTNHRMGLHDRAMIKDNHRKLWQRSLDDRGAGNTAAGLDAAVERVRERFPGMPVEIEVESEEELVAALRGKPDWVLLDNMGPEAVRRCVGLCTGACRVEASGGITSENLEAMARTGVDAISLGALTHSAPAADLSLEIA